MEYPHEEEQVLQSPLVPIFLKWFLRRENLAHHGGIGKLLEDFEGGRVKNRAEWEDEVRACLLRNALQTLGDLLERPLFLSEIMRLCERVDEFIQLYAMGLGTWL